MELNSLIMVNGNVNSVVVVLCGYDRSLFKFTSFQLHSLFITPFCRGVPRKVAM